MKQIRYSIYVNYISDRLKKLNPEIDQEDWQVRYGFELGTSGRDVTGFFWMLQMPKAFIWTGLLEAGQCQQCKPLKNQTTYTCCTTSGV